MIFRIFLYDFKRLAKTKADTRFLSSLIFFNPEKYNPENHQNQSNPDQDKIHVWNFHSPASNT